MIMPPNAPPTTPRTVRTVIGVIVIGVIIGALGGRWESKPPNCVAAFTLLGAQVITSSERIDLGGGARPVRPGKNVVVLGLLWGVKTTPGELLTLYAGLIAGGGMFLLAFACRRARISASDRTG
jgi:hypothetical protein